MYYQIIKFYHTIKFLYVLFENNVMNRTFVKKTTLKIYGSS